MKVSWRILGLAAVAALAACEPIDLTGGGGGTGGGAFSKGFVFVRNDTAGRNVYAVDDSGDANSPLQLTQAGSAYEPAVSPTGKLVAFAYRPAGASTSEIRTVPTTGQGQASTVISNSSTSCPGCTRFRNPTFSPDGNTIVFTLDKGGYSQLARIDTAGTAALQIITTPSNAIANFYGVASFYPNGQSVLATASNSSTSQFDFLVQVNVTTGAAQLVTNSLGGTAQVVTTRAVVSPDGTKVAFDGRVSSGGSQVFVANLSPSFSGATAISNHPGQTGVQDNWPSWRGNTEVGFLSDDGGNDNIYRLSIASSGAGTLLVPGALEPGYGGK
jgi:TolB protein